MRRLHLVLISFSLTLIQTASSTLPTHTFDTDKEEYIVYSTIIAGLQETDPSKVLFIIDRTFDSTDLEYLLQEYEKQQEPYLSKATLIDYRRKNAHSRQLTNQFDVSRKCRLLSKEELDDIFKDGCLGWCDFYKKYPDSSGYISFSRVGFNPEGSQAMVYVAYGCGGLCGTGGYTVLRKESGIWKVEKRMVVWVS